MIEGAEVEIGLYTQWMFVCCKRTNVIDVNVRNLQHINRSMVHVPFRWLVGKIDIVVWLSIAQCSWSDTTLVLSPNVVKNTER